MGLEERVALNVPLLNADDDKIVRVLQNLLDNAIKFSSSGSSVTIGAYPYDANHALPADIPVHPLFNDGEWVIFWYRIVAWVFRPPTTSKFSKKVRASARPQVRGTGLGLTFCKLAIEAHQGQIWLESEGVGSVFAFALPLNLQDEQ